MGISSSAWKTWIGKSASDIRSFRSPETSAALTVSVLYVGPWLAEEQVPVKVST
jgi:hypothetical protein